MKVALLGYGYWGKIVEPYLRNNQFVDLKKIYTRSGKDENSLFTSKLDDIMSDSEIDAVFICLPAAMHFEMCKRALENGKHVFCEKPLVKCGEDLLYLEKLAKTVQKTLYTDYIYTISPSIKCIKDNLPKLGDIQFIEGQLFQFGKFYYGDSIWENIGVHLISILYNWFPTLNIKTIKCNTNANGNISWALLEDERGMQMKLECSLLCPSKKRNIYIYGQNGSMCFDMLDPHATVYMNLFEANRDGLELREEKSWKYDEGNNLQLSVQQFIDFARAGNCDSNLRLSQQVDLLLKLILKT